MNSTDLAMYASVFLSLGFSYIPSADGWWENLSANYRRLVMLGCLLLVALASVGIACAGLAADLGLAITCDKAGFLSIVKAFVAAMIVNQAAYKLSPESSAKVAAGVKRVKVAKAEAVADK